MQGVIWEWSKENTQLNGWVPWATSSKLTRALEKGGQKGLAKIGMRLDKEDRIHLQSLYVHQKLPPYQKLASEDENASAKGLGHALLCEALKEWSRIWKLPKTTEVWLEASGGQATQAEAVAQARTTPLRTTLKSLHNHPKSLISLMYIPEEGDAIQSFLRRWLPGDMLAEVLARRVEEKGTPEYLHEVVKEALAVQRNSKLVGHYQQLGFGVHDASDGLGVVMKAPFGSLLEKCQSVHNPLILGASHHEPSDKHRDRSRSRNQRSVTSGSND
jgi:hypothetical protein